MSRALQAAAMTLIVLRMVLAMPVRMTAWALWLLGKILLLGARGIEAAADAVEGVW